ncbi:MAG TPA: MFS transporter [Steroidobacteraceae bacterium]|jgi:AAA family ATP:ADP antiporter|nr:MFS transporter [Steroidobacteraceae bacterium]
MSSDTQQTAAQRWLWRIARIEGHEAGAAIAGFAYIFCAFTAYMILRPVRETMGITSGVSNLPSLFWGTLAATLVTQPIFGWLTSRYRRTVFLPWVYGFFALNLVGFYVWFLVEADHTWIARAFFIWITVFALFVPSVFWSLMADIFKPEQAKRLYGFLAAGTSAGGVLGPLIAATLAPLVGTINLLLFSMVFLAASIFCIRYLTMWHERAVAAQQAAAEVRGDVNQPLGGSLWAGFTLVAKSPYLLSIAAFILLLTWVSTFLYLQQAELVEKALPNRDQQTQLFGWVDFTVQSLSLIIQLFALSRFTKWMRLSTVIMTAPILMVFGYSALALFPVLSVLLVVMVVRRVGEYALVRPCREMLFTSVDRETKYKAKNFIDTAVYRTGDATSGSAHALLSWLGVATSGIAWVGAAVAAVWAVLAYRIGNTHERHVDAPRTEQKPATAPASRATSTVE